MHEQTTKKLVYAGGGSAKFSIPPPPQEFKWNSLTVQEVHHLVYTRLTCKLVDRE